MRAISIVALLAFAAPALAVPQTFVYAGELRDGQALANGTVSVVARLLDSADAELFSETLASVDVTDGALVIEIGASAANPIDVALLDEDVRIELSVDGDTLPAARLATVPYALVSAHAATADLADDATAFQGVNASDVARTTALTAAGGPAVDWQNLVGRPSAFDDGDADTVLTAGARITVNADHTVSLGGLSAANVASNAITAAKLQAGTITAREIQDHSIDVSFFSGAQAVFQVAAGCLNPGRISVAPVCTTRPICPTGSALACNGANCVSNPSPFQTCPNTLLGVAVMTGQ